MSLPDPTRLLRNNLTIPTLPAVVLRITELLEDPETGTRELGALIAQDAPLTAKVLRIANSAFHGLREPCVSPEHASTVLGLGVLRHVVTQAAVMEQFEHLRGVEGFDLDEVWRHSIAVARVCAEAARRHRGPLELTPDELYTCGLLHDLGKIVMLDGLREEYVAVLDASSLSNIPLTRAEQSAFGFDHTDVGRVVAERWNLPDAVARAIHRHHECTEQPDDLVVALVARANRLVDAVADGEAPEPAELAALGLDESDARALVELASDSLAAAPI